MKRRWLALTAVCVGVVACNQAPRVDHKDAPIVGAWLVKIPEAPFPLHVFVFHADGTVVQSNPDAGDPRTSDSNLMGAWAMDGDEVKGKLVEVTADRTTHQFARRGEISVLMKVSGNVLRGTAKAVFFDANEQQVDGPIAATLLGQRIVP